MYKNPTNLQQDECHKPLPALSHSFLWDCLILRMTIWRLRVCRNGTNQTILQTGPNVLSVGMCGILSVVSELERNAEVVPAEESNNVLQLVFGRRGDAELIPLDGRLNFF